MRAQRARMKFSLVNSRADRFIPLNSTRMKCCSHWRTTSFLHPGSVVTVPGASTFYWTQIQAWGSFCGTCHSQVELKPLKELMKLYWDLRLGVRDYLRMPSLDGKQERQAAREKLKGMVE
jgi:hypothetical protein